MVSLKVDLCIELGILEHTEMFHFFFIMLVAVIVVIN